jgi:pyridoxine 5-phosphate synthase
MARLSVNVDHVSTLRQARLGNEPDPVTAALKAEIAGADGITVHLREDRRHIQDRDLHFLNRTIKTKLNLEMAATKEMLSTALEVKPHMVTIVPEKRQELTTEGGLDVRTHTEKLKRFIQSFKEVKVGINLFIDPSPDIVKLCHRIGAEGVEIHTGRYADCETERDRAVELKKIYDSVMLAKRVGLKVHAGHGLDYHNVKEVAAIREIQEFAIGFAIVARSIYTGIEEAVKEMVRLVR